MTDWFDEKASQVDVGSVTAFGIPLTSRYSKARELAEMLSFANLATSRDIAHHLKEVFYDSNSCCCSFKFKGRLNLGDTAERELLATAEETISQFEWFGTVYHGGGTASDSYLPE